LGVGPGAAAGLLDGLAKPIGDGLRTARLGKTRIAYLVRKHRVRAVAIASGPAKSRSGLREYLRLALENETATGGRTVPVDEANPVTPRNAVPLKLQPQKNGRSLTFICGLGIGPTFAAPK
jgi:hypothetical protein